MMQPPQSHELFRSKCRQNAPLLFIASLCLVLASVSAPGQAPANTNVRISQVYPRGGETGATYQSDFVEIFNRGNTTVDLNGWSLNIDAFDGSSFSRVGVRFLASFPIPPGAHLLFQFPGSGTNGQPLNGDIQFPVGGLGNTGGHIVLVGKDQTAPVGCPALPDPTGAVVDFVGYGNATCAEGAAAPLPQATKSLMRIGGGCTDTDNNFSDFSLADPAPHGFGSPFTPCGAQPASTINFSASQFDTFEGAGKATITVTRSGDASLSATVDYSTSDGTASERSDYTTAAGTLRFAAGETQKTFDVLITNDSFSEPDETVLLNLTNPTGNGQLGVTKSAQLVITPNIFRPPPANIIDTSAAYVDQHYHDFLNRVPDTTGLSFWVDNIESCGSDAPCREVKRIDTSAAFFLSIEFQKTGFLIYRLYKASLPDSAQRPRGFPRYQEFMRDAQSISRGVIVNTPGWESQVESNTVDFINRFVTRSEFLVNYPTSLTPFQYVDKLNAQAGNVLSATERNTLANGLGTQAETRATVLRKIAEHPTFTNNEFNRAFVLMQYFGYLRRNPNDLPNTNFDGFDFWLDKLNQFGDYRRAEMVKAFISSAEYRNRIGP
jgi:hypothetical protein